MTCHLRHGLRRPLMKRIDRERIAQAEDVVVHLVRRSAVDGEAARQLRRSFDPPGTTRTVDLTTIRVDDTLGLVASVRGFVDGKEDPGLRCTACPLAELHFVEDAGDPPPSRADITAETRAAARAWHLLAERLGLTGLLVGDAGAQVAEVLARLEPVSQLVRVKRVAQWHRVVLRRLLSTLQISLDTLYQLPADDAADQAVELAERARMAAEETSDA